MALFTLLTGNIIDVNNNPVSKFRYRGYHKETKTWSGWYSNNNETQYNFNMGDAAWLTPAGTVNSGDTVYIVVETLEDTVTARAFAMISLTLTNETSYVNDIQLLKCIKPNVIGLWSLQSPTDGITLVTDDSHPGWKIYTGRVGESIDVVETFNDNSTWKYNNVVHYHTLVHDGVDIFSDRLGVARTMYDWGDSSFVTSNTNVFAYVSNGADNGYYTINARITNLAGLTTTDTVYIKVKNNVPVLVYTWEPVNPTIKDTFIITGTIKDINSSIITAKHYFDNVLIVSNKKLSQNWEQSLGVKYVKEHIIKGVVSWSDGFAAQSFEVLATITTLNIPPKFTVSEAPSDTVGSIRLTCNDLEDVDGVTSNIRVRWELYFKTPVDNDYKKIFETAYPTSTNKRYIDIAVDTAGSYKGICYAIDEAGGETNNYVEFVITAVVSDADSEACNKIEWE